MDQSPASDSPQPDPHTAEAELLILPDGRIFAHNLTVPLHEVLSALAARPKTPVDDVATPLANRQPES
jgi:hypothetical protein